MIFDCVSSNSVFLAHPGAASYMRNTQIASPPNQHRSLWFETDTKHHAAFRILRISDLNQDAGWGKINTLASSIVCRCLRGWRSFLFSIHRICILRGSVITFLVPFRSMCPAVRFPRNPLSQDASNVIRSSSLELPGSPNIWSIIVV